MKGGNYMKPNKKTKKVKELFLGLFAAIILVIGVSTSTANAQSRVIIGTRPVVVYQRPFWRPFWGPRTITVVDPIAAQREQGYSDGKSRGKDDAKKGLADNPESHKHYNNSDSMTYRQAFLQGY